MHTLEDLVRDLDAYQQPRGIEEVITVRRTCSSGESSMYMTAGAETTGYFPFSVTGTPARFLTVTAAAKLILKYTPGPLAGAFVRKVNVDGSVADLYPGWGLCPECGSSDLDDFGVDIYHEGRSFIKPVVCNSCHFAWDVYAPVASYGVVGGDEKPFKFVPRGA